MTMSVFSDILQARIEGWTPFRRTYNQTFSDSEISLLAQSAGRFNAANRRIAMLVFENRHVSLGGLAAVTRYLPQQLARDGEQVVIITPFHKNNPRMNRALAASTVCRCPAEKRITVGGKPHILTLYSDYHNEIQSYYLDIDTFFTAADNPYAYKDPSKLTEDALAFCSAVPQALSMLGLTSDIIIHAHDWETGLASLTTKLAIINGVLKSAKTVLTLHNSFDAPLAPRLAETFFNRQLAGTTVLQCAIACVDAPLTTVSTAFARELLFDPLQTAYFCDHLRHSFSKNPPVGIENGIFGTRQKAFSSQALADASERDIGSLVLEKQVHRNKLHAILDERSDKRIIGHLSMPEADNGVPILFMSGRMDVRQKGFDVIFQAFKRLPPGSIKLLFSPSNDDNASLDFFTRFIHGREGDISIWPFRISETAYATCLLGSSYLVMPSMYEPFGAANEAYLHGTPVIARATGGLWAQVRSMIPVTVPDYFQQIYARLQTAKTMPTGILFREQYESGDMVQQWRSIMETGLEDRMKIALYRSMVDAATQALQAAILLYGNPSKYASVIYNGIESVRGAGWSEASDGYRKIYSLASGINQFSD